MKKGNLITIGSFDGVHLGHQALLDRTVQEAKKRKVQSLALTFTIPPKMVLDPKEKARILSDTEEKEILMRNRCIDRVAVLDFDKAIASLKPFSFFRSVLLEQFSAKGIVIGADFRFGMGRMAGAIELVRWGQEYEIPVWVISPVRHQKKVVSSSLIRHLLENNHFEKALGFLGHPYLIHGVVVPERGVGRKIGFPTANLEVSDRKILPRGVFVVRGVVVGSRGKVFNGVCNVGVRPTFLKKSHVVAEVHVLNGERHLSGRTVYVELLRRLRTEKKFKNATALKGAIASDVQRARAYLSRKSASN